jgi:hypothetical protein
VVRKKTEKKKVVREEYSWARAHLSAAQKLQKVRTLSSENISLCGRFACASLERYPLKKCAIFKNVALLTAHQNY